MTNGSSSSSPVINTTSAQYVVSPQVLGEGSNSRVHYGWNKTTGQKVALKIVDRASLNVDEICQLHKEAQILRKLSSDGRSDDFLRLYDVINQDNQICLVTELIEGGELHDYCTDFPGGVPERIGKWIFQKVLTSVDHLHDQDVCHLDLKLENIMYNKDTRKVKLIDFGFAAETTEYNDEGTKVEKLQKNYCGSVHYAPPEIVKRTPYNGKTADVWSLGVLLFVLLSGLFPFDDSHNRVEFIFDKIVAAEFFAPSFLSTDAKDILKMMLHPDPNKRPSVRTLLKHPWFSVAY